LDHDRRPETYLTGGSILGGNAGSVHSSNQQSEEIEAEPEELLKRACELGLEGIIAKRLDRPYRSGRLGDWLKIKCIQSDSFVVIGYEPSNSMPGSFASLYLAAIKGDGLVYVGSVGTGFKHDYAR